MLEVTLKSTVFKKQFEPKTKKVTQDSQTHDKMDESDHFLAESPRSPSKFNILRV